jgi:hypothetical protein
MIDELPASVRQTFLRHSKGQWAKKPFELFDWQWESVIAPVFGWKRSDGTRRYRRGLPSRSLVLGLLPAPA